MSRPPLEKSNSPRFRKTRAKESIAVEGKPSCPRHFTPAERKTFRFVCRELSTRRALTKGDRDLIVLYCETVSRRETAKAKVATQGEVVLTIGGEKKSPWLQILQETEKQLISLMDRLGTTPRSREMVKAVSEKEEEPLDELDILMGKGKRPAFQFPATEIPS
jgi:P27 family predicted phage terminase small subunit